MSGATNFDRRRPFVADRPALITSQHLVTDFAAAIATSGHQGSPCHDHVTVLAPTGPLPEIVDDLQRAVLEAWADDPRAVLCDLTGVSDESGSNALATLAVLGRHVRDWPAVPFALQCPDTAMRRRLRQRPMSEHLIIRATQPECLSELHRHVPPTRAARLRLEPVPTASRSARDFVRRACIEWEIRHGIDSARLVASEFVSNVLLHAGTEMEVSVARHGRRVRLAVRDHSSTFPRQLPHDVERPYGRGLLLVEAFSRAWGTLPAADGGKVTWAVLDV
jgi:hypothetical protein